MGASPIASTEFQAKNREVKGKSGERVVDCIQFDVDFSRRHVIATK
jgi:hypothetical protein